MRTQKAIAVAMILSSSVLTAWVSADIAYPAILCMLGLLGMQRRFTWDIRPERRVIKSLLLLLLAVAFALHYSYAGAVHGQMAAFSWQTIARYFLASMILMLFLGSPERLPLSLGLFHIAVVISAGQVLLIDEMYVVTYRLSELLSVVLVVLYAATASGWAGTLAHERVRRTSRWLACGVILLVAANCAWITSSLLYQHLELLNPPAWFWRTSAALGVTPQGASHVGFSTSGKLSNVLLIKEDPDSTPVLSIRSDENPGYLRARAFDEYRQSEWRDLSHKEEILPAQSRPFGLYLVSRTNTFRLDKRDASTCKYMTIRHTSRFDDEVFTPLGTSSIAAPVHLLLRDDDDIVYAPSSAGTLNYRIAYAPSGYARPPTGVQGRRMLDIPAQLDPRVRRLASRIFAGCTTTREKTDAVVNYFDTNYTYSLGVSIPRERDRLTHFLLEESSGYCEYFASGAAILLRLAGVPTRYVTGFFVTEKHEETGLWVARNLNAHAWAEAWDRERNQWTIVEATTQQDVAAVFDAEEAGEMGGEAGALLRQLVEALYQYGLFGVLSWFFKAYGVVAGLLVTVTIFGGGLWLALFRHLPWIKSRGKRLARAESRPELLVLHKMLARMDRKLKAAGLPRQLTETLHAFSQRLRVRDSGDGLWQRISDWYLEYASLRYCRTISYERLQQLQRHSQRLRDSL